MNEWIFSMLKLSLIIYHQCWSLKFPPHHFFLTESSSPFVIHLEEKKKFDEKKHRRYQKILFPFRINFKFFFLSEWWNGIMKQRENEKKTSHHIYCVVFLREKGKKISYLKNYMYRQRKDDEKIIWVMTSTSTIASVLNLEGKNFFFFRSLIGLRCYHQILFFFILVTGNFSRYQSFDHHQWSSSFVKEKKTKKNL